MIDWMSLVIVAVATLTAATVTITLFSVAVRLRADSIDLRSAGRSNALVSLASHAVFGVCGIVVLIGVYLIVPALHG
ncbi:hypothetical protein M3C63_03405 [Brevibacterium luteolum]|uniref:hypothetical protein n=1 Tax=Brevibacterium luteolum TaxID=199591 RepID=UPI00223B6FA4|nr:hypothetical protein [Brevibacterium luteolum]MCT1920910.1 hypothetical protein [Brevibacterium luteolum]